MSKLGLEVAVRPQVWVIWVGGCDANMESVPLVLTALARELTGRGRIRRRRTEADNDVADRAVPFGRAVERPELVLDGEVMWGRIIRCSHCGGGGRCQQIAHDQHPAETLKG